MSKRKKEILISFVFALLIALIIDQSVDWFSWQKLIIPGVVFILGIIISFLRHRERPSTSNSPPTPAMTEPDNTSPHNRTSYKITEAIVTVLVLGVISIAIVAGLKWINNCMGEEIEEIGKIHCNVIRNGLTHRHDYNYHEDKRRHKTLELANEVFEVFSVTKGDKIGRYFDKPIYFAIKVEGYEPKFTRVETNETGVKDVLQSGLVLVKSVEPDNFINFVRLVQ